MIKTDVSSELLISGTEPQKKCVLFVCTGNTCRSPMAEAYLRHRGDYDAKSCGIAANEGERIAENAVSVLADAGIELCAENNYAAHTAKNITLADMATADTVVAMTGRHASALMFSFPQYAEKITVMQNPISDPYGGDLERYKQTLAEIAESIEAMFPRGRNGECDD